MGAKIVRYERREQMERDVERLSDEGWVLARITGLEGEGVQAEYARRPSMVQEALDGIRGGAGRGPRGPLTRHTLCPPPPAAPLAAPPRPDNAYV